MAPSRSCGSTVSTPTLVITSSFHITRQLLRRHSRTFSKKIRVSPNINLIDRVLKIFFQYVFYSLYIPNMFSRQINAFALTKCTLTLHAIALYDLVLQIANLHFHTINVCSAELVLTEDITRRNSYLPTSKYIPACRYYDHSPHNAAKRYSRFT